jgi:hypothetical protein
MILLICFNSFSLYRPGEAISIMGSSQNFAPLLPLPPDVGMPTFLAIEHHHLEHVARFLVQGRHTLDLIRGRSLPIAIVTVDPILALPNAKEAWAHHGTAPSEEAAANRPARTRPCNFPGTPRHS